MHRRLDDLLDTADVLDGGGRQVGPGPRAAGAVRPALHDLVDGLHLGLADGGRRQVVDHLTVEAIADTHLDLVETVEHVELGQRDAADAVDLHRLAHHHRVEPAAAAGPAGHRSEFLAPLAEGPADLVVELRREGSAADAGRVRLGDAENVVEHTRSQTGPSRRLSGDGGRRRHERIGAVIDVEHGALGALEQDPLSGPANLVKGLPHGVGVRQNAGRYGQQLGKQLAVVHFRHAEAAQQGIVMKEQGVELFRDHLGVGEVAEADRPAADLVFVRGTDASPGGADLGSPKRVFAGLVEVAMQRQDQWSVLGDSHVFGADVDALPPQDLDFGKQCPRVEDDAVADDRELAGTDDARWQQAELVGYAFDDKRVAGIVTALESHHHIGALRQPVDDLSLAFVSPLRSDNHHIGHSILTPVSGLEFQLQSANVAVHENMAAPQPSRLGFRLRSRFQPADGDPTGLAKPPTFIDRGPGRQKQPR